MRDSASLSLNLSEVCGRCLRDLYFSMKDSALEGELHVASSVGRTLTIKRSKFLVSFLRGDTFIP